MRLYRTWRVARSLAARTSASNLGLIAAGVAFFGILAMFPALAALVALWGLFADPALVAAELEPLREILPPQAFDIVAAQISALTTAPPARSGWTTGLSLGAALWSARAGVAALVQGLNAAHGVENRGGIGHQAISVLLTLALIGVALALFAAGVVAPLVLAFLPLGALEQVAVQVARWTVLPAVTLVGLGLLFRYGPNLAGRRPRFLSPGLWLALALWVAASEGFAFYLANFASYNAVYGSIGAVVALMMWLYVSAWAVLLGATLNAALAEDQ
jgi:membrane protein